MASVGPFPSALETSVDSLVYFHGRNPPRSSVPLFACCRNWLDTDVRLRLTRTAFEDEKGSLSLSCGNKRSPGWMFMRVNASSNSSAENEAGDESEDALQATVESGKKVLAMQKNLFNQIAERRKLVSAIKSTLINEGDGSDVSLDIASSSQNDINDTRGSDATTVQATAADVQDNSPTAINKRFAEAANGSGKDLLSRDTSLNDKSFEKSDYSDREILDRNNKASIRSSMTSGPRTMSDMDLESSKTNSLDENSDIQLRDIKKKTVPSDSPPSISSGTLQLKNEKFEDIKESSPVKMQFADKNPINKDVKPPPLAGANVMNIILVALECAPWIKTGGLGDVAGALPRALARRGHRVMAVVPRYGNYSEPQDTGVRKMYKVGGQAMEVSYFQAFIDGVDFVFIDSPIFRHIEKDIYGGNRVDILKRMVLFCKAAVEVPWYVPCGGVCYGDGNLVFIANDWHTALLPVYLKAYYRDHGMMKYTRSVLVIHNIAHQGRGPVNEFSYLDLPSHFLDLFRVNDSVGGEHLNIFAAGLKTADRLVTVSHSYAEELKNLEGGWGLHGIINENEWKLKGIVNGIDTKDWNPMWDIHLQSDGYTNYSLDTLQTGKAKCKEALQKELGLPVRKDVPLIGFIGRLDHQKGVDLIAEAVPWLMSQGVQLVMLGTGRPDLEQMLRRFENQYRDNIRSWVGFSVKTAHRITAGSDVLLMPSRFEPCGLNQLYAMTYGTVPVVHEVGGLRDTVQAFNPFGERETGVGWTFGNGDVNQMINALGNCLLTYRQYKTSWEGIQKRGMMQDLSWDTAAQNYEEVLIAAKHQW